MDDTPDGSGDFKKPLNQPQDGVNFGYDANIPPPIQPGAPIAGQPVAYAPSDANQPAYGMPSQPGYGYAPVMQ